MIAYLKGTLLEKRKNSLLLEVSGVGYEVQATAAALERLPPPGQPLELFISESVGIYGGETTLYGFPSRQEQAIFHALWEHVPNTGARKALEYLERAAKSLPDFRRAILEKDARILAGVFGFTKKTAEKLVAALQGKLFAFNLPGEEKWSAEASSSQRSLDQALEALTALGYRPREAREALSEVHGERKDPSTPVEEWIRLALKRL